LLAAAATLHSIETAGLTPDDENGLAQGLYDWMHELPEPTRDTALNNIEWGTHSYAQAAADEAMNPAEGGQPSQLELEFFDRLLRLR
jgi:hypothetical protein